MDLSLLGMLSAAGEGSSSSKKADGNPVVLDGLQGDVPFNSVTLSGKNLLSFSYYDGMSKTENGITFNVNGDGSVIVNGTATARTNFALSPSVITDRDNAILLDVKHTYVLSGCPDVGGNKVCIYTNWNDGTWHSYGADYGSGLLFVPQNDNGRVMFMIRIEAGYVCENLVFRPQLELGSTPTSYEPPITGRELTVNVNGAKYTITPDSNPYIVPVDITQYDGINVLSISDDSNPTISVSGNKASEQLGTIYRTLNNKPVLLFDGNIPTSSSAGYAEFTIDKEYSALIIVPICNESSVYEPGACTVIPIGYMTEEEQGFTVYGYPRAVQRVNRPFIKRIDNTIYVRSSSTACNRMTIYGI